MRSWTSPDLSPPTHRGVDLSTLQRSKYELFAKDLKVLAVRVQAREVGRYKKELEKVVLALPKIPSVKNEDENQSSSGTSKTSTKLVLLDTGDEEQLPFDVKEILRTNNLEVVDTTVRLGYEYWTANQILRAILPSELLADLPSAFTTVGHIAHFNLREEYLPYKQIIGQVIMDKNTGVETVVNKLDEISNEFRFFKMEVLAGKEDFEVEVSECNCRFQFDFSKVYWNSRLQAEHLRLVESFDKKDVIADGFAGVGPFAVPAAKKGCLGVFANDLNPASASSCQNNAILNKVQDRMRCYNMDGGKFFAKAVQEAYANPFKPAQIIPSKRAERKEARRQRDPKVPKLDAASNIGVTSDLSPLLSTNTASDQDQTEYDHLGQFIDHFVLNLPATAIEFLGSFQNLYQPFVSTSTSDEEKKGFMAALKAYSIARGQKEGLRLPIVHCYCFTKELDRPEEDIRERATSYLGYTVSKETLKDYSVTLVRSVAPKKDMYRLSFRLPEEVVFEQKLE